MALFKRIGTAGASQSPSWRERKRAPAVLALLALIGATCTPLMERGNSSTQIWSTALEAGDANTEAAPATDGERLYALVDGLTAFDLDTGERLWTTRPSGGRYLPRNLLARDGRVFAAGGAAFAFDAESGRELWRFSLPIPDSASAALGRTALDESTFYVGTDTHQVFALDQATGTVRWSADIGPDWPYRGIITGITVEDDTIFVSARQYNAQNGHLSTGWIIGLDRATGRAVWRFRNGNGNDWRTVSAGVSVAGRLLLASDHLSGSVFAVDRSTGKEAWRMMGPLDKFGSLTSPVALGQTAYFGSIDTYVYAVDVATGTVRWKTSNPGSNFSVTLCRDQVFANYMSLAVLDRASGRALSRSKGTEVFSEVVSHGSRAFVVSENAVYGYRCE